MDEEKKPENLAFKARTDSEPNPYEVVLDHRLIEHMTYLWKISFDPEDQASKVEIETPPKEGRWIVGIPERIKIKDEVEAWMAEHIKSPCYFVGMDNQGNLTVAFESLNEATHFKLRWVG